MKASNKGWDQCGNAQAVANEHQIILAADVTDQANDVRQAVEQMTGKNVRADGRAFFDDSNFNVAECVVLFD